MSRRSNLEQLKKLLNKRARLPEDMRVVVDTLVRRCDRKGDTTQNEVLRDAIFIVEAAINCQESCCKNIPREERLREKLI